MRSFTSLFIGVVALGFVLGVALAAGTPLGKDSGQAAQPAQSATGNPAAASANANAPAQAATATVPGNTTTGDRAAAFQGQSGAMRPVANGPVEKVEGNLITIKAQEGSVKVNVPDGVTIRKTVTAALTDVKAGENVVVTGERQSDGTVTATTVQLGAGGAASIVEFQTTPGAAQGRGGDAAAGARTRGGTPGPGTASGPGGTPAAGGTAMIMRALTNGTVESVEGTTMTVKTQDGSVKVKVADGTAIRKTVSVGVGDIKPGDNLVIMGDRGSDGTITASNVQVTSP